MAIKINRPSISSIVVVDGIQKVFN